MHLDADQPLQSFWTTSRVEIVEVQLRLLTQYEKLVAESKPRRNAEAEEPAPRRRAGAQRLRRNRRFSPLETLPPPEGPRPRPGRRERFATPMPPRDPNEKLASIFVAMLMLHVFLIAGIIAFNLSKTEVSDWLPPLPERGSFAVGACSAWALSWYLRRRRLRANRRQFHELWLD